jgi:hypothetical protein
MFSSTSRNSRFAAILGLFMTILFFGTTFAQNPARTGGRTKQRLTQATDKVLQDGLDAYIPPNVSALLGITPSPQQTAVKQRLTQNKSKLSAFNVSIENPQNIVLFVNTRDPATGADTLQTYYLTSPQGALRKVLAVEQPSGTPRARSGTEEDKAAFAKELQSWLDRLEPPAAK